MRKRISTWSLIVCLAMFAVGCGGGTSQSTPKETFNGFKDAVSKDDWGTAFKYVTDDSQDMMLGGTVYWAIIKVRSKKDKDKRKELEDIMKKHGIDKDKMKGLPADGDFTDACASLSSVVKDKGACLRDFMKFIEGMSEEKKMVMTDRLKETVFKDAKIEGDKATATFTFDGKDDKRPMIFKKINGKWYIDMIATGELQKKSLF